MIRLIAIDGLDQADGSHLDDVVEWLSSIGVAAGYMSHEREVHLHEFISDLASRGLVGAGVEQTGEQFVFNRSSIGVRWHGVVYAWTG